MDIETILQTWSDYSFLEFGMEAILKALRGEPLRGIAFVEVKGNGGKDVEQHSPDGTSVVGAAHDAEQSYLMVGL
jgi:hypothetical protein